MPWPEITRLVYSDSLSQSLSPVLPNYLSTIFNLIENCCFFFIVTSANFAQSSKLGQIISRSNHTEFTEWIIDFVSHSPINL